MIVQLQEEKIKEKNLDTMRCKSLYVNSIGNETIQFYIKKPKHPTLTAKQMGSFLSTFDNMFCKFIAAGTSL